MCKYLPLLLASLLHFQPISAQQTEIVYLSGTDALHTKEWDFTCSAGRKSGSWEKIEVPSCWEQQGFGEYNYGHVPFENRLKETGTYRYNFNVPQDWKANQVKIVFEGVMTDASVKINGQSPGDVHQGAFYQFEYDITKLLKYGEGNTLEVLVKKFSDNESINYAERRADFWIFGGIFRPVYLEVLPQENIDRVVLDAKADGSFKTETYLQGIKRAASVSVDIIDGKGNTVGSFSNSIEKGKNTAFVNGKVEDPQLWSPEFPHLYHFRFQLLDKKGEVLHTIVERSGFRTVEVREQDGIYVNGVKVKLKGVNRHTFHPDYARTSSKTFSIADVNRIKDMNMNAVRMSHYPPEKHFLDICDSLGLFVLDELTGWQWPSYDTEVGRKLLKEMIERDVNHPSIVLWDNGNEGGWNTDYDADFQELDIQKREVLHPWAVFEKFNTAHYFDYNYLSMDNFAQRKIFMPTEFLHGLYDGGHGAGLEDYWQKMYSDPLCSGGFLWAFADECVMRTDTKTLDCDGNHAPDGIFGPYFEKEGSFYAIRETWAPIRFEERYITPGFNGLFNIENRFYYTNLDQCQITFKWIQLPSEKGDRKVLFEGDLSDLDVAPQQKGSLAVELFDDWKNADVLSIDAYDPHGRLIHTWTWPVQSPEKYSRDHIVESHDEAPTLEESDEKFTFHTGEISIEISKEDGTLINANNQNGEFPIAGGPYFPGRPFECEKVEVSKEGNAYQVIASYEENMMNIQWKIHGNGSVDLEVQYQLPRDQRDYAGVSFSYLENEIESVSYMGNGPYRVWKNRMKGTQFGVWDKPYNNTITGYSGYEYPEFKGFYSNLYRVEFTNKSKPGFTVFCKTEDIFLRLFTPENPSDPARTKLDFPEGDISFMHGIMPIGTKFKDANVLGPQSSQLFYLPRRVENGRLSMALTFDFATE